MASLHRLLSLVPLLLLIILSAQNLGSLEAEARNVKNPTKLLFAFGDSYADTGNVRRDAVASSWKQPYGITFPGIPAGRFSDGRVLTDFLGFIMMCPQLFINYKLKSVAHLPWRQMTYKFLNTIIDDLFAFVIKMPTLHRLSVFRDDIIFLIYLYQRWVYPVDKKRINEFGFGGEDDQAADAVAAVDAAKEEEEKKTN
ncbi:hypothetical protein QN277_010189 [Acacia crassicarpa]|uniref:GDSL esterase/lipase n=1 Tax=Acacia crassicarpa TaxID=499986 RepID=A0AAE1IQH6_9FABA|nr:hypothetical protein QN277_010189 [Acacia crassicarpa]